MTETLMEFSGKGKLLTDGKRPPIPLTASLKPERAHDMTGRWAEKAEWMYGGVGFAGFNTPHAGGGCACWYCRFTLGCTGNATIRTPAFHRCDPNEVDVPGNGDPFDTGDRNPETGMLRLGQTFTSEKHERKKAKD